MFQISRKLFNSNTKLRDYNSAYVTAHTNSKIPLTPKVGPVLQWSSSQHETSHSTEPEDSLHMGLLDFLHATLAAQPL